ncbi:cytochrome p450 monooxygenase [Colletotrichum incanum]|uniref:Cytochrome p450 monooxygenase n=1 Tax=Colletotrichum incanum TaxID=1573173 RepID=A0A167BDR2_COLIC|nr:cytochrome p450 monooxygenase [Colletotrichum incanum]OHW90161.1 cytochrome p450 monooxygenase [Colletotrichum incanum]
MDGTETARSPLGARGFTLDASVKPLPYFLTTVLVVLFVYSMQSSKLNIPSINQKKRFELTNSRPKRNYLINARGIIRQWFSKNPNKPTRLISDMGETIVLPPSMANEIRNNNHLSFTEFSKEFFQTKYPGFNAFAEGTHDSITLVVINKDLTKQLAKVTEPLAEETSLALRDIFTENKDWHSIPMRATILHFIARISSRVFLGTELCRNESWLEITKNYTLNGFTAADRLREYPPFLRNFVHWFLPGCQSARKQIQEAAAIIQPIIDKRHALKAQAIADGRPTPEYHDAIEWFEQASVSKGMPHDPALSQLFLSTVAIHTTTDLLGQVLVDLAKNPEIIKDLQKEALDVLKDGGWKKTSLYSMKLLDSVVKESQRIKPLQLASMQRVATTDVTLSDGTFIPKGTCVCVSSHAHWDPKVYPEPEHWDGYRFYRMREQTGQENVSQLVSTSPEHLGFGHGKHACPGRFFAANEIKIALVHILLQYEWKIPTGANTDITDYGISPALNPNLELEIRRRSDEVDLNF